ncbi:hypothetical protein DFH94DRAFT_17344 [Russula ochroleuca]|jgi:hypothetical protein|uniref:Uncharacterized protein n=1 Tax=Russula ochroleuca TaxID=152965 RepID=A0A9P5N661_9AGAM|nr:hypothetical protein DFH94DRAFT_17344 [Russula ochroleuca]
MLDDMNTVHMTRTSRQPVAFSNSEPMDVRRHNSEHTRILVLYIPLSLSPCPTRNALARPNPTCILIKLDWGPGLPRRIPAGPDNGRTGFVSCSTSSCAFCALTPPRQSLATSSIPLTCLPPPLIPSQLGLNPLLLHALPTRPRRSPSELRRGLLLNAQFPILWCSADMYTCAKHCVPRMLYSPGKVSSHVFRHSSFLTSW